MPFFTIITPTYNRANLIGATVAAVLNQSFTDFEFLIIDDGSTDNTKEIIDTYKDERIRYIYQQNGERGKARNKGVSLATGSYVFFLDSDDLIYTNHLELAYEMINRLGFPEFFHSRYEEVKGKEKKQVPALNPITIHKQIQKQNKFACQFFLKKDIALDFPFSENRELKIGEDWEVILRIAQRFTLNFSNIVTAAIVQHDNRSMAVASAEVILKSRNILIENLKKDIKITPHILGNVFAELTTLAALSAAISTDKKQAFNLWWKGIVKRPKHIFKRRTLAIFKRIIKSGKT